MKFSILFLLIQFGFLTSWNQKYNYKSPLFNKKSCANIVYERIHTEFKVIDQFIFVHNHNKQHCKYHPQNILLYILERFFFLLFRHYFWNVSAGDIQYVLLHSLQHCILVQIHNSFFECEFVFKKRKKTDKDKPNWVTDL